jgi:NAD-dependent deacetylase
MTGMTTDASFDRTARERAELGRILLGARRGVAFTGAGISTESGIPDFRSPGGLWSNNMPIPFDRFVASADARAEAWRRKFTLDDACRGVQPNVGHEVVARLIGEGGFAAVVTQNIDGLHQASGVPADRIVELHGNGTYARCLGCDRRHELDEVRARFEAAGAAPDCEACGAPIKSATISFGQAMPVEAMRRAEEAARAADVFLVLGSSLVVYPAASLPLIARRAGATLVIVNREPTELDAHADLVINAGIGEVLGPFLGMLAFRQH